MEIELAPQIQLCLRTASRTRGAGFEGYVAKDEASPYVGGRTRAWLKVKVPG